MALIRSIGLVAVLTPVCWVSLLLVLGRMRQTGLLGDGLAGDLFEALESYAWVGGIFLALVLAGLLQAAGGLLCRGVIVALVVLLVSGVAVWWVKARRREGQRGQPPMGRRRSPDG